MSSSPLGVVRTYQAMHLCLCYNYYLYHMWLIIVCTSACTLELYAFKSITYWWRVKNGSGCSYRHMGCFQMNWQNERPERLKNYFVVHDIKTEAKKRAVLLGECGMATYKVIKSLIVLRSQVMKNIMFYLRKPNNTLSPHHCALWSTTSSMHMYSNTVNQ